ncbi:hypothetical protein SAMN05446037_104521 [Anaerovirgula multivorans]|uniref:Uncharacterized protein n=1 Tax=Anaerovirgula multivorans TaxID=312168 RepID=A0A239KA26_9FIRM|nr:hypothetical protein [Anaerovirgula multivorans]SNT15296.1 hypothetical protein SAMN05446037_104521 [Anaerovirgula multivorans]
MNVAIVLILIPVNIPIYKFFFKTFFSGTEDFNESLRYSFTPDLISLFRGEYWKDRFAQMKLSFFLLSCGLVTFMEYAMITSIIEKFI